MNIFFVIALLLVVASLLLLPYPAISFGIAAVAILFVGLGVGKDWP